MSSIRDERGFNQGFRPTPALVVRTRRRADWIGAELPAAADAAVLEIGCGTGALARELARKTPGRVVGLDISPMFIDQARRENAEPNLDFRVANFATDPIDGPFDCIVGNGILHHLYPTLGASLLKLRELLKPGGRMVFLEPNLFNPYVFMIFRFRAFRRLARLEPDEMAFTKRWIERKLELARFENVHARYKDFLLPNTPTPLIRVAAAVSGPLEKVPGIRSWAQSLFITATKPRR
jgi:SAM-dependent methyltransferase